MLKRLIFTTLTYLTVSPTVSAHHSKVAHFDTSRYVTVEGEVVKWRFRSPHSSMILNVTAEDGTLEKWTVEGSAAPTLKRQGITRKTFLPGDKVRIRAEPSRNPNANVAFALTYQTEDGKILGARLNLDKPVEIDSNLTGIQRLAGRWEGLGLGDLRKFKVTVNAKGQEALDNYDDELSPGTTCEPVNIPTILHVPNFLFDVRIDDEKAVITNEIYEVTRTAPLGEEFRQAEPTGKFGFIRARIEDDVLVVESKDYLPSKWGLGVAAFKGGADIPSSSQKHVIERYSSKDNGRTLRVDYTIEDPTYLAEPYIGWREFERISDDTEIHPYECSTESASSFVEQAKQDDRGGKPRDAGELMPEGTNHYGH